jgi:hypothetical protein
MGFEVSTMKKLAVIYHGAHGHTEHIAKHVLEGATAARLSSLAGSSP